MIRLVLTDLDNTLVDSGRQAGRACITPFARQAVRQLQETGVRFGPATGRMPWMLTQMLGDPSLWATSVQGNGQVGYLDGQKVFELQLDDDVLQALGQYLKGVPGGVLYVMNDDETWACGMDQIALNAVYDASFRAPRAVERVPAGPWVKANVHLFDVPGAPDFAAFQHDLEQRFPQMGFVPPTPFGGILDIVNAGSSKAVGIQRLLDVMGLAPDELVIFGDADNDLEMLSAFPHSVAVANAVPEVLRVARHHIGPASEDAVAHALVELAEATKRGEVPAFLQ